MTNRHTIIPAVYLLLRKEDQVLLARRANTSYYDGWYSLLAGHVEQDELPKAALVRECEEEIGLTLAHTDLTHVHTMYRERTTEPVERVDLFFQAEYQSKYEPTNCEPEKCDELRWVSATNLPENTIQNVRQVIEAVEGGVCYSEKNATELTAEWETYQKSL